MIRIAVDAMGSDNAPYSEVEGALQAVRAYDVKVLLVGIREKIEGMLSYHRAIDNLPIEIVPATEVIGMDEQAAIAVRKKKDSSIRVAARLVRDGLADGLVSAGNTGAVMATAKLVIGALEAVDRPALATVVPTRKSPCVLIDVGANVDCKPNQMVQFAIMGHIYSRAILGKSNPRVGLMSIGAEQSKGTELTKEVFKMLSASSLNFVGNVEGRDVYNGKVDVIVTDGFTGNVSLKISEGLIDAILGLLKEELNRTLTSKFGALLAQQAFKALKKRLDYSEYGGAPLLGTRAVTIICHGRSNSNAIKNAIRVAKEYCDNRVNSRIEDEINSFYRQEGAAGQA